MNASKRLFLVTALVALSLLAVACSGGSGESTTPAGGEPAKTDPAAAATTTPKPVSDPAPTGSGSISGVIHYEGEVPRLPEIKMDADPGCSKKHDDKVVSAALVLGEGNSLANVFVRVTGGLPAGSYPVPAEPVLLDQKGCIYSPHVSGVRVGQTFRVLNSDGLLHNVHGLPKENSEFNRAMPAAVTQADWVFDREEVMFKIKCDVHPWMNAYVGVLPHPYFAVSATDGGFAITGLPDGTYEVEAWHERLGTQTASVTVAAGGSASADFTFTR